MELSILTAIFAFGCVGFAIWTWRLQQLNSRLRAELLELSRQLDEAVQRLSKHDLEETPKALTKVVDLLAAAGIPGLILVVAMYVSGFTGAAAITVALASLGGPVGMLGVIGTLLTVGIVLAKYGVSDLTTALIRKLLKTKSKPKLLLEVDNLPAAVPKKIRDEGKLLLEKAASRQEG